MTEVPHLLSNTRTVPKCSILHFSHLLSLNISQVVEGVGMCGAESQGCVVALLCLADLKPQRRKVRFSSLTEPYSQAFLSHLHYFEKALVEVMQVFKGVSMFLVTC